MNDKAAHADEACRMRIEFTRIAAWALTSIFVLVAPALSAANDWPRFLGPTGDGKSPETGLRLEWPSAGPPVVWQKSVGDGYSMPSISGGRLFLFDRHRDVERLFCLKAETGEELWSTEYPVSYEDYYGYGSGPRASPVIDGDRVYTFGVGGRLRCQAVADGRLIWQVDTATRYSVVQNFFGTGATPVVEGELLILPIGGSPPDSPEVLSGDVVGLDSGVVAFDKLTGEERYRITDELASYASPTLATIGGRRWAFVLARGGLVAFEPATGQVDFRFPWRAKKLESVNAASPVVVGDTVLISEAYGPGSVLLRVRPGGYEVVWQDPPGRGRKSLSSHWATPIHHQGVLYGVSGAGSGDAELRALEWSTGKVLWSVPGLGRSTLLLVDGRLIVLTERGRFLVVRATGDGYEPISDWTPRDVGRGNGDAAGHKALLQFPTWNPPILANGLLYAKGKDRLVCLDLTGRASADSFEAFPGVVVDPGTDLVFAMSPGGGIDAITLADGRRQWHAARVDRPLLVRGSKLLAQFDVEDRPGQLGLVWLETDDGSRGGDMTVDLPRGVRARADATVETRFVVHAKDVRGEIRIEWEFRRLPATGVKSSDLAGRPASAVRGTVRLRDDEILEQVPAGDLPGESTDFPPKLQALVEREGLKRPPWRVDGLFVHTQTIDHDPRRGARLRRFDPASGDELPEMHLFGDGVLAKTLSTDGGYQLGSRPVASDGAPPLEHEWTVVSLTDGRVAATFRWPDAAARFFVVPPVLVVWSPPRRTRVGDEWQDESLALVAVDLSTGKPTWKFRLRDVEYRGTLPPSRP